MRVSLVAALLIPVGMATAAARPYEVNRGESATLRHNVHNAGEVHLTGVRVVWDQYAGWITPLAPHDPVTIPIGGSVAATARFRVSARAPVSEESELRFRLIDGEGTAWPQSVSLTVGRGTMPAQTRSLTNYPNPFNPETWIPFELSEAADVSVYIHSLRGDLVRVLDLGRRGAGRHHRRGEAAYWDGRNTSGEAVASGVYVYELRAGAYRRARRMLIAR